MEFAALQCPAIDGIKRPFVLALEMLDNVLKKPYRSQAAVLLAAVPTVFQVHLLALVGLVTVLLSVVERHHTALDLVLDRIVRPSQMLGYAVNRPAIFQSNFNFVSFFTQKVLTFSMFCGIIGIVHSDDPFGIVVSATSILPQNRYYGYSFLKTNYCNFILQRANEEKIEANSKEQKRKFALWIKESTLDLTKQYREQADCKSQSEFIEKAIRFYVEYLAMENCSYIVPNIITSTLKDITKESDNRQGRLLFKIAVELSMLANIIAGERKFPPHQIADLRAECINEVKRLNGTLTFEEAVEWQNSYSR